jgi:protein-tyrosine-phosphatase
MSDTKPHLLFVSLENGGKSQMAAALARQIAGDAAEVTSAGTKPGAGVRPEWLDSLREVGADPDSITPQQVTDDMLRTATHVVRVGVEAPLEPVPGMAADIDVWEIDAPDVKDEATVRRIREDLSRRVIQLVLEATGQPAGHAERYTGIISDLARQYEGIFTYDEVRAAVRAAHAHLAPTTRAPFHLPLFVERLAHEQLRRGALAKGAPGDGKHTLLFLSVNNSGRSQIAAALALHLSGGQVNVRTAGVRPAGHINPIVRSVLRERGIDAHYFHSEPLDESILQAADVVVSMGGSFERYGRPSYPGKRYEDWDIADPEKQPVEEVRRITDEIEARVRLLLDEVP